MVRNLWIGMIPTNVSRSNFSSTIRRDALFKFCWLSCVNKRSVHTEGTDENHNNRGIMNKSSGNDATTRHLLEQKKQVGSSRAIC